MSTPPYPHHATDPWTRVRTVHDLAADEVISALQKAIRRGEAEAAVLCALELSQSGPALETHLWSRLQIIAAEDVGLGEPLALPVVRAARDSAADGAASAHDRVVFAAHTARYLATCAKDRTTSEMLSVLLHDVEHEGRVPEIPDHALCVHTRRGQEDGRTLLRWLEEGAVVSPEVEGRDLQYHERLRELWQDW